MNQPTCIELIPDPYDGGWIISSLHGRVARRRLRPLRPMHVSVHLRLPRSVYQLYAQEAASQGVAVSTVLATMLRGAAVRPMSDDQGA